MNVLLAYRTLYLGDVLTAVPALRALARAFPRHECVVAVTPALCGLTEHACPGFRALPTAELTVPRGIAADVAVNLHGRGPHSHRVLGHVGARRLVAFAHPDVGKAGPAWSEEEHEVARWCRMLEWFGVAADAADLDIDVVPAPGVPEGATVVHPGASAGARRWPAERWAAVARHEAAAGRPVVVTGSAAERELAAEVAARAGLPQASVWAGRTRSPLDLAAVVAAAATVVCGDTGTAHLATALRVPSVVLFGPVSPARWGPPPTRPWHRALWAGVTGDPHGPSAGAGLRAITVDDVVRALADARSCSPVKELR